MLSDAIANAWRECSRTWQKNTNAHRVTRLAFLKQRRIATIKPIRAVTRYDFLHTLLTAFKHARVSKVAAGSQNMRATAWHLAVPVPHGLHPCDARATTRWLSPRTETYTHRHDDEYQTPHIDLFSRCHTHHMPSRVRLVHNDIGLHGHATDAHTRCG